MIVANCFIVLIQVRQATKKNCLFHQKCYPGVHNPSLTDSGDVVHYMRHNIQFHDFQVTFGVLDVSLYTQ